jgi:hypothetical protein
MRAVSATPCVKCKLHAMKTNLFGLKCGACGHQAPVELDIGAGVRTTDPETSHEAYAKIKEKVSEKALMWLERCEAFGEAGATCYELAVKHKTSADQFSHYFTVLFTNKLTTRPGERRKSVTGCSQNVHVHAKFNRPTGSEDREGNKL